MAHIHPSESAQCSYVKTFYSVTKYNRIQCFLIVNGIMHEQQTSVRLHRLSFRNVHSNIFFPRNDGHSALALMYYHLFCHEWVTTNPIWVCKHPINRSSKYLFWSKTKQASKMILPLIHYNDIMMCATASQITSLTIVDSTVYSDADQRKHQSSASLAFVRGIQRDRWIPRTNGQ